MHAVQDESIQATRLVPGGATPIRVVMFGSGPKLNHDVKQFLCRLEEHPEIALLGAFCQAESNSTAAVIKDLWHRRGILSIPLFIVGFISEVSGFLRHPKAEIALHRTLKQIAERIHFVRNIHSQDVLDQVRALHPDLGLIYGSPILRPELFEIPELGTLGIHHGRLPEYRGNKTAFWAMFNGEPAAGVTIQKVNKGLDTGSIVKQGEVLIGRKSYPTVFRELEVIGLDLYIRAILEVKNGTATFRPQSLVEGKLYRNPKLGDFLTYWLKQSKERLKSN
jgi:folate-dependent phosphoribosylglycinamide formyltransferase PurN